MNVGKPMPVDAGDGLCTPRLNLRRFTMQDLPWLAALYADAAVAGQIGGIRDAQETRVMLEQRILAYYDQHPGLGVWITTLRESGTPVGFHLLNHIQGETLIQVGYALPRAYWGHGYATEMARALLRYGYEGLGLPQIVAITNRDNAASQRVLLKAGLGRNGERSFAHPAYARFCPMAYFESSRGEWLAGCGRGD